MSEFSVIYTHSWLSRQAQQDGDIFMLLQESSPMVFTGMTNTTRESR